MTSPRKNWRLTQASMTPADVNIAEALRSKLEHDHRGQARAIRGEELARHFAVPYNTIRQCVYYLIAEHGVPIGTALAGRARGYYLIETREESQHSLAIPRARATENWAYYNALARAVEQSIGVQVEQLKLGLGG